MTLNHFHFNVPDVQAAVLFYERYFGFKFKFEHGDGAFIENEAAFLLAIDPLGKEEVPHKFPDWFHFGFCLDEPEKVRILYRKMQKDGVTFYRELMEFDDYAVNFYCSAPGGYKIEVSWNR